MSSSGSPPPAMGADAKSPTERRVSLKFNPYGTCYASTSILTCLSSKQSSQGVAFAGLVNQKRNSIDAAAAARRASFHDSKPQAGFMGQMWNK
jgi:hypothetical protein